MEKKPTFKRAWWKYLIMLLVSALHATPFYVMITMCLKDRTDLSSRWAFPATISLDNFVRGWNHANLPLAFKNNIIITVCSSVLIVLIGAFAGYPLARRKTRLNNTISRLSMGIMMVPPLAILVPIYSTLSKMHGVSTYWGIIALLVTFNLPLSIYLFSNFIRSIPSALDEAAEIDGCGYGRAFFKIILPQLKPVIASVIIMCGLGCWNDYSFSLYVMQSPEKQTLTLVVSSFFSQNDNDLNAAAAVALMAVAPLIIAYLCLQKYFVQGMVDSAVK